MRALLIISGRELLLSLLYPPATVLGAVSCILLTAATFASGICLGLEWRRYDQRLKRDRVGPVHWAFSSNYIHHRPDLEEGGMKQPSEENAGDIQNNGDRMHQCDLCWETKRTLIALSCHHFFCRKSVDRSSFSVLSLNHINYEVA